MGDLLSDQGLQQALTWRGGRISFRANRGTMGVTGEWEFPSKPVPVLMALHYPGSAIPGQQIVHVVPSGRH